MEQFGAAIYVSIFCPQIVKTKTKNSLFASALFSTFSLTVWFERGNSERFYLNILQIIRRSLIKIYTYFVSF